MTTTRRPTSRPVRPASSKARVGAYGGATGTRSPNDVAAPPRDVAASSKERTAPSWDVASPSPVDVRIALRDRGTSALGGGASSFKAGTRPTSTTPRGPTVPASLRSHVVLLSEAGRADVVRLFALHGGDRKTRRAMTGALAADHLWSVPMRPNDERRALAAAIACVPVSPTPARRPDTATFLRGGTDGRHAVPDALPRVAAAYALGDDVTIAPEWWFVPKGAVAHLAAAKDALVAELAALTQGSDRLLVPGTIPWRDDDGGYHNTAYAFANGRVLHEVDKRGDGDDVDIASAAGLTYASRPSTPTFEWRGMTTSLEVCRDHGDARLRWDLLGAARDSVDLQLVVSSGVWLKHAAIGVGGAALVAQGDGIMGPEAAVRSKAGLGEPQTAPHGDDPWRVDLRG